MILFSRNRKYISALAFITTTSLKTTSSSLGSYLNKKSNKTEITHFHFINKLINFNRHPMSVDFFFLMLSCNAQV